MLQPEVPLFTPKNGTHMKLDRSARAALAAVVLVAATAALAACGAAASSHSEIPGPTPASTGAIPTFDGPYAAEFADFYARASSDFVREVLKDGLVTDAEFAEMTARFTSCLADQGVTFQGFDPGGGFGTSNAPNGGDTETIVNECSHSSGQDFIGALYSFMKRNPDNLDSATITKDCLIRKGVVPPDYSAEEFAQDNTGRFADFGSLPNDLQKALVSCSSDPLGLLD